MTEAGGAEGKEKIHQRFLKVTKKFNVQKMEPLEKQNNGLDCLELSSGASS